MLMDRIKIRSLEEGFHIRYQRAEKTHEQETIIEGALLAKLQICGSSKWRKNNGRNNYGDPEGDNTNSSMKPDYLPCHHFGKKGNAPRRSWIRPDVKCNKYTAWVIFQRSANSNWKRSKKKVG